ncbi:CBASS cGAMP-activated phospholipase [Mesorhizobium sp.]|uniref:CBASS cGAMP-activated phospholipase n=1 Tax=Mesorhizobium sp. TaxID=1871066 RepID=UPI00257B63A1|nr:CBASS cGAMP-activated phospholipase [Mesorhizobium sp.]
MFQILSLSGGGFLGLYTAIVLAELEEVSGQPLADRFDLIAGTSVGGILGIAVAARVPMSKVVAAFEEHGHEIFSDRPVPQGRFRQKLELRRNALGAKYRPAKLREVIVDLVGEHSKMQDLSQRLIVPAVNLTKGSPQLFKTPHHETILRDGRLALLDVALATSAAPTFFPVHAISGELFADGGLFANSPDQQALHEAEHFLGQDAATVKMVSVGTTTSQFSISNATSPNMGWIDWMSDQRLPKVMIAAQQIIADAVMKHRLGGNYLRIDRQQSAEQERFLALDVANRAAVLDLRALAEASIRENINSPLLKSAMAHNAPQQKFGGTNG